VDTLKDQGFDQLKANSVESTDFALDIFRLGDINIPAFIAKLSDEGFTGASKDNLVESLYNIQSHAIAASDRLQWLWTSVDEAAAR